MKRGLSPVPPPRNRKKQKNEAKNAGKRKHSPSPEPAAKKPPPTEPKRIKHKDSEQVDSEETEEETELKTVASKRTTPAQSRRKPAEPSTSTAETSAEDSETALKTVASKRTTPAQSRRKHAEPSTSTAETSAQDSVTEESVKSPIRQQAVRNQPPTKTTAIKEKITSPVIPEIIPIKREEKGKETHNYYSSLFPNPTVRKILTSEATPINKETRDGNWTRQFINKNISIILILILLVISCTVITCIITYRYLLPGNSPNIILPENITRLDQLEKKFKEFTENVKSVPALYSQLKEAEEKNDRIKSDQSRISEIVANLEMSLHTAEGSLVTLMSGLDSYKEKLNGITNFIQDIDGEENKLLHFKTEIQQAVDLADKCLAQKDDLSLSCSQIDVKMIEMKNQFEEHQKNLEDMGRVHDHLSKNQLQLNDDIVNTEQKQDDVDNRLHGLDTGIRKLDDVFNSAAKTLDELKREIGEYGKKVENYRKDFRLLQNDHKKVFDDERVMEQTYTELMPISTIVLICMVIAYVTLSILFCIVCRKGKQTMADTKRKTEYLVQNIGKPTLRWESFLLLDEIKKREELELEKKYCIVSFHPDTHHRHIRMVGVCVEGRHREKNYEESDFIVTSHKNIPNIPYVMVTLVFIDYNKQGQILETPGQDSNDIKLLTVMACRKKSKDVFVIYVGDEESRSLMPGLLFNPHLKTVTEHFELKQLEQKDRVLTVHERFTITQREKIAEAIA